MSDNLNDWEDEECDDANEDYSDEEAEEEDDDTEVCELCGEETDDCTCEFYCLNHLDYQIGQNGNVVSFKILEQSDEVRKYKELKFFNGMMIVGDNYPALEDHKISLRGKMTFNDELIAKHELESEDDAMEYLNKVVDALEEWSNQFDHDGLEEKTEEEVPAVIPEATKKDIMDKLSIAAKTSTKQEKVTRSKDGAITFSY